jgi:hypothetical protein
MGSVIPIGMSYGDSGAAFSREVDSEGLVPFSEKNYFRFEVETCTYLISPLWRSAMGHPDSFYLWII